MRDWLRGDRTPVSPRSIAALYLVFGIVWILFTDGVVTWIFPPQAVPTAQLIKGLSYIGGSAVFIYSILGRRDRFIREEEERFQEIIERSSDIITLLEADGTIKFVSPSVKATLGYDPAELIGKSAFDLIHEEDVADVQSDFNTIEARPEGTPIHAEYRIQHADGSWRWHESRLTVPRNSDNGTYVLNSRDVTELRDREGRLSVLDRVLRHNLRNQLNLIIGHVESVKPSVDPSDRDSLDQVLDSADELLQLSESARKFESSIRSRGDVSEVIDVNATVQGVVDRYRREHADVVIRCYPAEDAHAMAHESFEIAIAELLDNAVKHCDSADPCVEISIKKREKGVTVAIADNGPGMPNVDRQVIMKGEETPLEHGMGLGLWLVKWTVENSGGSIDIRDNDPAGTIIEIRLPRGPG
mgnify:CR=1 FL=1